MTKFILGKKLGMTTIHGEKGAQNVTLVLCLPNKVTLVRNKEKDGYDSIQLEIKKTKNKSVKKEFRIDESELKEGDEVNISIFSVSDNIKVTGISKAKGFQGVVKRHGFKGAPASHGHKHDLRAPGSIGAGFPEHVIKGKRMAGRMGGDKVSTKSLKIISVDTENNIISLKGTVPGNPGGIVEIRVI